MSEQTKPEDKAKRLDLRDPGLVAALEVMVFTRVGEVAAEKWLAGLALLLVAKQDTDEGIEMNVNGIRVSMTLLPPDPDSPMCADDDDEEEYV